MLPKINRHYENNIKIKIQIHTNPQMYLSNVVFIKTTICSNTLFIHKIPLNVVLIYHITDESYVCIYSTICIYK